MKKAQETLNEAQRIAEKYGMNQLIKKILEEQRNFFKQKNKWQKLKETSKVLIMRLSKIFQGIFYIFNNITPRLRKHYYFYLNVD